MRCSLISLLLAQICLQPEISAHTLEGFGFCIRKSAGMHPPNRLPELTRAVRKPTVHPVCLQTPGVRILSAASIPGSFRFHPDSGAADPLRDGVSSLASFQRTHACHLRAPGFPSHLLPHQFAQCRRAVQGKGESPLAVQKRPPKSVHQGENPALSPARLVVGRRALLLPLNSVSPAENTRENSAPLSGNSSVLDSKGLPAHWAPPSIHPHTCSPRPNLGTPRFPPEHDEQEQSCSLTWLALGCPSCRA